MAHYNGTYSYNINDSYNNIPIITTSCTTNLTSSATINAVIVKFTGGKTENQSTASARGLKILKSGLENAKARFFGLGTKCCMLNGTDFIVYDGTSTKSITENPYIPTLTIGSAPTGGGTAYEQFNLLSTGFKDSFSADGIATIYQVSLTNLDLRDVSVLYNNVTKIEGTHFTVDRTAGTINFSGGTSPMGAPAAGTNNVIITAHKTITGFADRIKKCTVFVLFGGDNDTRLFVSGNNDFPSTIWRSGITESGPDISYFPENQFQKIGTANEKVINFSKQYDTVIIHKDRSKYQMQYEYNNGSPLFPVKPINDAIGCYAIDSVQVIDNTPIALDRSGVHLLVQSNVRDERNVQLISNNVDPLLLKESNLQDAISCDFDKKYILGINDKCYVYDYQQGVWYVWDNIPSNCFLDIDNKLYFGSNETGMIYRFKSEDEYRPYNDDGNIINAYWKSKPLSFNADEYVKQIDKVFFSIKPAANTSANLYYATDDITSDLITTLNINLFDFNSMDFSKSTFKISSLPQEDMAKIRAKKIVYFQMILKNNKIDESLGILSVGIKYSLQRLVK